MVLYRRSLAIDEAKLGADHTSVAYTLNNMASVLEAQGELEEATRCAGVAEAHAAEARGNRRLAQAL